MKNKILDIVSGLLVLLFAYTAMSKLFGFAQFRAQLAGSPWLGLYAGWLAWLVPAVELVIVGMLTVNVLRRYGLYASLLLLAVFTIYIGGMLLTQQHLPCSCGGVIEKLSWKQHLVLNALFMALCGWGIIEERRIKRYARVQSPASS